MTGFCDQEIIWGDRNGVISITSVKLALCYLKEFFVSMWHYINGSSLADRTSMLGLGHPPSTDFL